MDEPGHIGELCHFVVVYPGTLQDILFQITDFFQFLLIDLPGMLWKLVVFIFEFLALLPGYVHKLLPFIPQGIITLLMVCIYFGVLWGIYLKFKKLKGD